MRLGAGPTTIWWPMFCPAAVAAAIRGVLCQTGVGERNSRHLFAELLTSSAEASNASGLLRKVRRASLSSGALIGHYCFVPLKDPSLFSVSHDDDAFECRRDPRYSRLRASRKFDISPVCAGIGWHPQCFPQASITRCTVYLSDRDTGSQSRAQIMHHQR